MDLHQCSVCVPAKRNLYLIRYIYISWSSNWQRSVTKKKGLTKFHKDHVINSQSMMHHTYLNINLNYDVHTTIKIVAALCLKNGQSLFFFNVLFFKPNVHHSFWKLKRILTLIIRKGFELMNCFFYNPFEHICLKNVFDLKNYGFWKCDFNKSCSYIYVIKGMNA